MTPYNLRDIPEHAFWYAGSPYTKFAGGLEEACRQVSRVCAWLLRHEVRVFCPVSHSHAIAKAGHIEPRDHEFWMPTEQCFMHHAHGLLVIELEGWDESYGLSLEVKAFEEMGKPIERLPADMVQWALMRTTAELPEATWD